MLNMWIPKERIPIQVLLYSFRAVLNIWIPKDQNILAVCKNKKTSKRIAIAKSAMCRKLIKIWFYINLIFLKFLFLDKL